MVGIIDYGVGNLFSLRSSFAAIGAEAFVSGDAAELAKADRLVLPGVGAFGDAAEKLRNSGLADFVKEEVKNGKPLLGICLGMQLLFEKSYEYGEHKGLGLLAGSVVPMQGVIPSELKIPHIGWNGLHVKKEHPIFKYIKEGDHVYFVHSYYLKAEEPIVAATTEYVVDIHAAVEKEHIFACQFHPEKSGDIGLKLLKNFATM